jgi:hypothetical protein
MIASGERVEAAADHLCALYVRSFGGKDKGRYRIPTKLVSQIMGRRRLYEDDFKSLARAMFERGYVLIDLDAFCVVLSTNTFTNYRRANDDCLG